MRLVYNSILEKVTKAKDNKDTGAYLKHLFFSYGAIYHWSELIKKATGEELTPKYYAKQFVG